MPLQMVMESLDNDSRMFDKLLAKCDSFFELSQSEYEVNLKEAELQYMEESENSKKQEANDKAREGLIARGKEAVKKIITELKATIAKMVDSVKSFFAGAKVKESLSKIEKIVGSNKELANKKVEVPSIDEVEKVNAKFENEMKKVMAQAKGGKTSGLKEKIETLRNEHKKAFTAAMAATTVVTVSSAILLIKKHMNPSQEVTDVKIGEDGILFSDDNIDVIKAGINFRSSMKKDYVHAFCRYPMNILNKIKGAVTGTKAMDPVDVPFKVKESGDENTMNEVDETKMESVFSQILSEVENMYQESSEEDPVEEPTEELESEGETGDDSGPEGEPGNVEESAKDLDAYLDNLEKEIITESEEDSSSTDSRLDDILDDIENSIM